MHAAVISVTTLDQRLTGVVGVDFASEIMGSKTVNTVYKAMCGVTLSLLQRNMYFNIFGKNYIICDSKRLK
jgi:hypothetical protein